MSAVSELTMRSLRLTARTLVVFAAVLGAGPAHAQESDGARSGAEILAAVNRGESDCSALDDAGFEAVGEFMMERMLGSAQRHRGMDRAMGSAMGEGDRDRMHRLMGRRLSGCGGDAAPGGRGEMMATMMMGAGAGDDADPGSGGHGHHMMLTDAVSDDADNADWAAGAGVLMGLTALALLGVLAYLQLSTRDRRRGGSEAIAILDRRLAAGEIERGDYERRRQALADT